jgi:hypothetical protein
LPGRKVLVSIELLGKPDWENRLFPINLTKKQVEESPPLEEDAPVSYEYEKKLQEYLEKSTDWLKKPLFFGLHAEPGGRNKINLKENHLRSSNEIIGYHIKAIDGEIGHVEDFIFEDDTWNIRYIIVDTRNWLPGRKVLISPFWTREIDWIEKIIIFDLTKQAVKRSPLYDASAPVNRNYELALYDYYGRPKYWE